MPDQMREEEKEERENGSCWQKNGDRDTIHRDLHVHSNLRRMVAGKDWVCHVCTVLHAYQKAIKSE